MLQVGHLPLKLSMQQRRAMWYRLHQSPLEALVLTVGLQPHLLQSVLHLQSPVLFPLLFPQHLPNPASLHPPLHLHHHHPLHPPLHLPLQWPLHCQSPSLHTLNLVQFTISLPLLVCLVGTPTVILVDILRMTAAPTMGKTRTMGVILTPAVSRVTPRVT